MSLGNLQARWRAKGAPDGHKMVAGIPIIINESPMIFWDDNYPLYLQRMLGQIDTEYFRYQARVHIAELDGPAAAQAGMAIRLAYSHAAETLFALIFSALQAPHYPIGWLLRYQYKDLGQLALSVDNASSIENLLNVTEISWETIATALIPWENPEIDYVELRRANAVLWRSVARNILDEEFDHEYMSLKHGFRVITGPWQLALGVEDVPGQVARPENMKVMASSEFGSSFYQPTNLKKHNWMLTEHRVNWSPFALARKLELIANSMDLILLRLKVFNADGDIDDGFYFMSESDVRSVLDHPDSQVAVFRFTRSPGVTSAMVGNLYNKTAEIRAAYEKMKDELRPQSADSAPDGGPPDGVSTSDHSSDSAPRT